MAIVVVDEGALRSCRQLTQLWPSTRRVGLFSNDPPIDRHLTIDLLDPCEFSGYAGEQEIVGWGAPEMQGDRAVAYAQPLTWTFDGGYPTGWVVGMYCVDEDGVLLWVDEAPDGPVAMTTAGQTYSVTPALSAGTRYGGDS